LRILAVDDDGDALRLLTRVLATDHEVVAFTDGAGALEEISRSQWDLVCADLGMPPPDGFDILRSAQRQCPPPAVVVITALDSARAALEALRLGARDYLVKPVEPAEIRAAVSRLAPAPAGACRCEETFGLIGPSAAMRQVRRLVPLLSRSCESALILGETGCGKELVARALHEHGPRRAGPFVAHNMAATPGELAESLFFGHVRGAFSGATEDHAGLFQRAHGGTLFLDEVDSFPVALQAKLLRALETGRVQPVGGGAERTVDVRVVAASSVDVGELVQRSAFRADLYYRLRQLEIVIPPLRERPDDIVPLSRHFLDELARQTGCAAALSEPVVGVLLAHSWPGNCRELRNAVRSAVLLADGGLILPGHLPRGLTVAARRDTAAAASLAAAERDHILRILERTGGNRTHAARLLEIDRGTLIRKLRALGLAKHPERRL
jgi:two-component system NtrC family response regulator